MPSPGSLVGDSREANGLTYPLCTRKLAQLSPYNPGDFVFGTTGLEQHIGVVTTEVSGRQYAIRFLTAPKETAISEDEIAGQLCTPGSKRPPR